MYHYFNKQLIHFSYRFGLVAAIFTITFLGLFRGLDYLFPFPVDALYPPHTIVITDQNDRPLRFFLAENEQWHFRVALKDISPEFLTTIQLSEDRYFYQHFGINPGSIIRAAWRNIQAGKIVSGASTISMQIARLAEPKPRNILSKITESFRALQLERSFSKDQLLELYVNLAPLGRNFVGVGAAAHFFFGKTPDKLSLSEAALLTSLLKSPNRYDPIKHPGLSKIARKSVLQRLHQHHFITAKALSLADSRPLPVKIQKLPMDALHFSQTVKQSLTDEFHVTTTIDREIQNTVDELLRLHLSGLKNIGINNAAAVVIENKTGELKAMVGSGGFFDDKHQGQINGTMIRRSPGSTLKPFLYTMAFDSGKLIPQSYLVDIPIDFSGYQPKNYDQSYMGQITAEEALIYSRNVPAVRLLKRFGPERFWHLLNKGGLRYGDKPYSYYGLPLILGSYAVTLMDLTNFYSALANLGQFRPVKYIAAEHKNTEVIFSPEASWLTLKILAKVKRDSAAPPDLEKLGLPELAWKSGTSFGHKDALAIGVSGTYSIGVWVGNFDGKASKGISGTEHAAPLLFRVVRAIEKEKILLSHAEQEQLKLSKIQICSESHLLPDQHCQETIPAMAIDGVTMLGRSQIHKKIFLDKETGLRLNGPCLSKRPVISKIFTDYPNELVTWWHSQGIYKEQIPPLSHECKKRSYGNAPNITSPAQATPYIFRKDISVESQRIALKADVSSATKELVWFQDDEIVARSKPGETAYIELKKGQHKLLLMDQSGSSDHIVYNVK